MNKCKHPKYKVVGTENTRGVQRGNYHISNIIQIRVCKICGKKHQKKIKQQITQRQFL